MIVKTTEIELNTTKGFDITEITEQVQEEINQSRVKNGIATIATQHTTTAIFVNEYEEGFFEDLRAKLKQIAPANKHYNHNDLHKRNVPKNEPQNGRSHVLAALIGNSQTIPIVNGKLKLGTWQSIFLIELDSARFRKVSITVIGQ